MPKLDARNHSTLPGPDEGKFDLIHWDADLPGFGLRVLASGARSWVVRYRVGTRQRVVTIAKAGAIGPDKARRQAGEILAKAKLGTDARLEISAAREQATELFEPVAKAFIAARETDRTRPRRPAYIKDLNRYLLDDARSLGGLPVKAIGRQHIARVLDAMEKRGSHIAADRCRAALSALFTWAIRRGYADVNPAAQVERKVSPTDIKRKRTLTDTELVEVWRATEGPGEFNAIVRLLMLTGQRREEVAAMGRQEIDRHGWLWRIPGARAKNRQDHDVPLSDAALAILASLGERPGRELVFGERTGGFSGWSQAKRRLDDRLARARALAAGNAEPDDATLVKHAFKPWRLHDLRRSVVTGMADIGVQPHVIEAVVNHISGHKAGVAGVYNRATYAAEKRQAMDRWAEHVLALVAGEPAKVVPLRRETA